MKDALWDFFAEVEEADMKLRKYYDRLGDIYDQVPEDLKDDFERLAGRLATLEDLLSDSSEFLGKIKEAILENN